VDIQYYYRGVKNWDQRFSLLQYALARKHLDLRKNYGGNRQGVRKLVHCLPLFLSVVLLYSFLFLLKPCHCARLHPKLPNVLRPLGLIQATATDLRGCPLVFTWPALRLVRWYQGERRMAQSRVTVVQW
jgi:hypothetical protein